MPRYQIEDAETGRTMIVEGDSPPSEQDALELFGSIQQDSGPGMFKSIQSHPTLAGGVMTLEQLGKARRSAAESFIGEPEVESYTTPKEDQAGQGEPMFTGSQEVPGVSVHGPQAPRMGTYGGVEPWQRREETSQRFFEPSIGLPKFTVNPDDSRKAAAGKAAWNLATALPEFMSSAAGITTLATPALKIPARAVSGGFALDMLSSLGEQVLAANEDWEKMTPAQQTEVVVNMIGTGAFAGLLTGHAAKPRGKYASRKQEAAEVHGDVRPPPIPGERQVPAEVRREGVQSQAEGVAKETPLPLAEEAYLKAEREAIENPVEVVESLKGSKDPFAKGKVASMTEDGRILIDRGEWNKWMEKTPPDQRQQAIRSLLAEEVNHDVFQKISTAEERAGFWDNMTGTEKALWNKVYLGEWSLETAARKYGREFTPEEMGFEAFNQFQMRLSKMTPREVAEAAGLEKWTVKTLTNAAFLIYKARRALGTKASAEQAALLDRLETNIGLAIAAAGGNPAAINKRFQDELFPEGEPESASKFAKMRAALNDPRVVAKAEREQFREAQMDRPRPGDEGGPAAINKRLSYGRWQAWMNRIASELRKIDQMEQDILSRLTPEQRRDQGYAPDVLPRQVQERRFDMEREYDQLIRDYEHYLKIEEQPGVGLPHRGPDFGPNAINKRERHRPGEQPDIFEQKGVPVVVPKDYETGARVAASEMFEQPTPAKLQADAVQYILTTPLTKTARAVGEKQRTVVVEGALGPSFNSFSDAMRAKYGDVRKGQMIELWQDAVWSALMKASPEQLEQLRSGLGLEGIKEEGVVRRGGLGTRKIAAAPDPYKFQLEQEFEGKKKGRTIGGRVYDKKELEQINSNQKYRARVTSAIAQKLIGEAQELKADLKRDITPEDLSSTFDFVEGIYNRVMAADVTKPEVLRPILTEGARVMGEPVSVTKRLAVLLDKKTGQVEMVSVYSDPRSGVMAVDPVSAHVQRRSRPLSEMLNRYQPIYSVLLDEPVQNFHKHFENLDSYQAKFGKQARDFSRRTNEELGVIGEGSVVQFKRSIDAKEQAEGKGEGLPDLEAQALEQMFGPSMDPRLPIRGQPPIEGGPGVISQGLSGKPATPVEMRSLLNRILDDDLNPAKDLPALVSELAKKAADDQLRASDYAVISALSKMASRAQKASPDTPLELLTERLSREIDQLYRESETHSEFIQKAMVRYGPEPEVSGRAPGEPIPGVPQTGAIESNARELSTLRSRAPTAVEGAELGTGAPLTYGKPGPQRPTEMVEPGVLEQVEARSTEQPYEPTRWSTPPGQMPLLVSTHRGVLPGAINKRAVREHAESLWSKIRPPHLKDPQAIETDFSHLLPRFPSNVNDALTRASGIERIPLIGQLWGPRGSIRSPVDRTIIGHAVKRNMGRSLSALNGKILRDVFDELGQPFKVNKDGQYTNVAANEGRSLHPDDVWEGWQKDRAALKRFKNLEEINKQRKKSKKKQIELDLPEINYDLTPQQKAFFETLLEYAKDAEAYLEEKNVKLKGEDQQMSLPLDEGTKIYKLPRVALHKKGQREFVENFRRRIGGTYRIETERLYPTEEIGARTTVYDPDIINRAVVLFDRVYKAVADADLANDPVLQGMTPDQMRAYLSKEYETALLAGDMTLKDIEKLSYQGRMGIEAAAEHHPAFAGKLYPISIANRLNRAFSVESSRTVKIAEEATKLTKGLMLTADLAQYMVQGSLLAFRSPGIWARATSKSIQAIADPNVMGRMLRDKSNRDAAVDFIQHSGTLATLHDFMAGAQRGEILTKVPYLRQVPMRSGQAFGTFFDVAKLELWKALRESTPREQRAEMARTIENMVLSASMESTGITPGRAAAERIALMAPSYYRAAFQLVANAAEGGVQLARGRGAGSVAQVQALRTLGQFVVGATLAMYGAYKMAGMDNKEITERLTPNNGKFLSFPVPVGNRTLELGIGGIIVNMLGLAGRTAHSIRYSLPDIIAGGRRNPFLWWLRTKLGPVPGMAFDIGTGKDYAGREISPLAAVGGRGVPISVSEAMRAGRSHNKPAAVAEAAGSFLGLRASSRSAQTDVIETVNNYLKKSGTDKDRAEWKRRHEDEYRPESDYRPLRMALLKNDYDEAREELKALLKVKGNERQNALEMVMQAMHPTRRSVSGLSWEREAAIIGKMTRAEKDKYRQALRERAETYQKFQKLLRDIAQGQ